MKTSSKTLFFIMMLMSTILVLSSTNWVNLWIGLEINLMSFIPMMYSNKNTFLSQGVMMYFLVQSMSSMLYMLIILTNNYIFIFLGGESTIVLIMMIMMIKMGMPPFHMWFPEIMNKMSWKMCFIMMTWQKMAPMCIMSMIIEINKIVMTMICLSALMGSIGGINQTSTRKILAYSSMSHMSWMAACAATFEKSWISYLMIYSLILLMLSTTMYTYNVISINQMNFFFSSNVDKMLIIFLILSLGGLPPFLGFLPKWIVIQHMIHSQEFIMMMIMVTSALITLSYYMRMSSSMSLLLSHSQKWNILAKTNKKLSLNIFSLNLMLPLAIMFMNFF